MITGVLNDGYLMKMMYEDTYKSKESVCVGGMENVLENLIKKINQLTIQPPKLANFTEYVRNTRCVKHVMVLAL